MMGSLDDEIDAIIPCPEEKSEQTALHLQESLAQSETSLEANINERPNAQVLSCIDNLELWMAEDGYLKWKPDASGHPRNWSTSRKLFDTSLVLMLDLFTTAISTAGPSAAEVARFEYRLSRVIALVTFGSMYQFGQAFGGVLFPPYSEAFGRKSVYISASLLYCISCLVIGAVHSVPAAVIGRFVSGFMSAVPSIIVSGSIEDMYDVNQRVWLMYAWACATTLGLLVGPIYGSYIAITLGWRWIFHIAAITTACFTLLLFFIRESRQSQLLAARLATLQKQTGLTHFKINNPDHTPSFTTFTKVALRRPIRLFFTEPIVFVVSIMSATGWALIYLFTEAIPVIYSGFGLSRAQSSLLFLAMAVGLFFGIFCRFHDQKVLRQRKNENKALHPEDKLTGFSFAAPALAAGLWWLVLSVPPASNLPWYGTIVGLIPIGFATNEFACTLSGYLADTYTIYASSSFAAMSFLRALLGGLFPLIGEPMFARLGANWALFVLAGIATLFCVSPRLFGRFGLRIRQKSEFAKYSMGVHRETAIRDDHLE